jgi:hypothetical protein
VNYELRKVRKDARLSEETDCFSAEIVADGRRIGEASNHGTGGPNEWHIAKREDAEAFEAAALAWAKEEGITFEPVESFIDVLLDDQQNWKIAKRNAKKGLPVSALVRVGDDPLTCDAYICSAKERAGIEQQAAKLGGVVRRWYEVAA